MLSLDPLQPRREALQAQHSVLIEKLSELRYSYGISADASTQFQLKKQIEQIEAQLEALEQQLVSLERTSTDGLLYQALLRLGYRKQVQMFRKFVLHHPIAAFLIHGKEEYGQQWLLNRLVVQHTRDSITGKVIKVSLARVAHRSDVAALWRELGKQVGLGRRQSEVPAIVERVYQWWRTQNVLLIFYDVDFLPEAFLEELLRDFWIPIVTQTGQGVSTWERGSSDTAYMLLMFLVDRTGCVGGWSVPFAETLESSWQPKTPVKLPVLSEFTESELSNWLEFSESDLPVNLVDRTNELVQETLENSDNGIPEPTFEEICQWIGLSWAEAEKRWMKL
jgi:hypothetical protein